MCGKVGGRVVRLVADVLCRVDGLNAFLGQELALDLVPDWPVTLQWTRKIWIWRRKPITKDLLLASAAGKPSVAFELLTGLSMPEGGPASRTTFSIYIGLEKVYGALFKMETGCSLEAEFRCEPGTGF